LCRPRNITWPNSGAEISLSEVVSHREREQIKADLEREMHAEAAARVKAVHEKVSIEMTDLQNRLGLMRARCLKFADMVRAFPQEDLFFASCSRQHFSATAPFPLEIQ
jgi:hypothetical protein